MVGDTQYKIAQVLPYLNCLLLIKLHTMQVFVPGSNSCPLLWRVLSDSASQKYDSPQIVPSSIFVIGSFRKTRKDMLVADTWSYTSRTILNFTFQERCLILREIFAGSYSRKFLSVFAQI